MSRFLTTVGVFVAPFLALGALFLAIDPFRVLYHYADDGRGCFVTLNYDFVSTEKYLHQRAQYHYGSFIFGSSRAMAFNTADWQPFLPPGSSPFSFCAWMESLYGIRAKVQLVDRQGDTIHDALVLICPDLTLQRTNNSPECLFAKHPALSGESRLAFISRFAREWVANWFFLRYLDYATFKTYRPWLKDYIETRDIRYDPVRNDVSLHNLDEELLRDPEGYYLRRRAIFQRPDSAPTPNPALVGPVQLQMLRDIHAVFLRHRTRYRVVICPLYNQMTLAPSDLQTVRDIFGAQNVFDFSGVNSITSNPRNYYDFGHFVPSVGRKILAEIYSPLPGH